VELRARNPPPSWDSRRSGGASRGSLASLERGATPFADSLWIVQRLTSRCRAALWQATAFSWAAFLAATIASSEHLPVRTLTTSDGLPRDQLACVHNDPRGFLCAGTNARPRRNLIELALCACERPWRVTAKRRLPMEADRRKFLRVAGAAGTITATGGALTPTQKTARAGPVRPGARGMANGLTLLTLRRNGECRLGVKTTDRGVLDVREGAGLLRMPAPATMDDLLQSQDGPNLNALVDAALKADIAKKAFLKEETVEYGPLVTRPEKIVCVGLNYRKHAQETNQAVPKAPILFNKFNNALSEHNGKLKLPVDVATKFDHEVELVIVMGKEAKNVSEADALSIVAGYATGNDFSARDLQLETGGQWMIGKTLDQFAPLGPYLVTADQIDPDQLKIECRINGETRQSSNTSDMVFNTRKIISYISRHFTLRPGDIIFTGTPEGVIQGKPPDKRVWLRPGDKVACSIERLGELRFELV
jgi:2-keto-4-pentenoate hydratase/2-oxohepta-3-ene-1,7-dioic acid hydratase in catechol pathway